LEDFKTKDSFLKDKKIVLGLSGGIDSVVLLHYLHKHYPNNLRAVHCNHHLSKHCSEWEVFCKDLCAALNIPYTNIDIQLLKVSNIEENARKIRYHSLSCNLEKNEILCTAHPKYLPLATMFRQVVITMHSTQIIRIVFV
jgi:tRNA(Ile)-lysidine synthase